MSEIKVNWSGRGHKYTQKEIDAVVTAMNDGDTLTLGKRTLEFEEKFAQYCGLKHAFAVGNCTQALEMTVPLAGLKPGDEVIVPGHTFSATAIPYAKQGCKLLFADIDPDTRLVTADTIRKCITPRTKMIVVVHLYGLMCDMDPIVKLAEEKDLWLVEDAAQAIGAEYKGKRSGSFGDFACYSFHSAKNLTTLGEGGMLGVKDDAIAKMAPGFRHNGVRPYEGNRPKYWIPAMSNVDFDIDGIWPFNFCITEVQAAVGSALLDRVDEMNAFRNRRAEKIRSELASYPELSFQKIPSSDYKHCYHLLSARYDGQKYGKTRDDLIETLFNKKGVKAIVQYHPLYRYPIFKKAGFTGPACPNIDHFYDNMISFPFHHWLPDDQFDYMIQAIKEVLEAFRR